jgi:hypothetical protein
MRVFPTLRPASSRESDLSPGAVSWRGHLPGAGRRQGRRYRVVGHRRLRRLPKERKSDWAWRATPGCRGGTGSNVSPGPGSDPCASRRKRRRERTRQGPAAPQPARTGGDVGLARDVRTGTWLHSPKVSTASDRAELLDINPGEVGRLSASEAAANENLWIAPNGGWNHRRSRSVRLLLAVRLDGASSSLKLRDSAHGRSSYVS